MGEGIEEAEALGVGMVGILGGMLGPIQTREDFDNYPWKDIPKESEKDWRRSGYGEHTQESLTDLHGPRGTRGRDPRRMDSST